MTHEKSSEARAEAVGRMWPSHHVAGGQVRVCGAAGGGERHCPGVSVSPGCMHVPYGGPAHFGGPLGTEGAGTAACWKSHEGTPNSSHTPWLMAGVTAFISLSLKTFSFVQIHHPRPGKGHPTWFTGSCPGFPFPSDDCYHPPSQEQALRC